MIESIAPHIAGAPDWLVQAILAIAAAAIGVALALIVHSLLFRILSRIAGGTGSSSDDILVRAIERPSRYALAALGVVIAARAVPSLAVILDKINGLVMPLLVGWIALAVVRALVEVMSLKADISVVDNRNARRRRTRLGILSRIASFVIVFLTVALMLFSIPGVQKIGATPMASAGLAALAVGAAAQPALKALIAGFQMALTEPIAIDDVVIVDGQWGRIEEIRNTYVVVRIWDDRRLVVPTVKFLEEPFENWTRRTSELLGTVMLYLDPSADVAAIREEFTRQVTVHPKWDKRAQVLQVTDHTPDAMEVRLLMSARNSGELFDLRCALREGMIDWIRRNQPGALVRRRTLPVGPIEIDGPPSGLKAAA